MVSTVPRDLRGLAMHSDDLDLPLQVHSADVRLVDASAGSPAKLAASALGVSPSEPLLQVDRIRSHPPHRSGDARWERAYMPAHLVPANVMRMEFAGLKPASLSAMQITAGLRRAIREVSVDAQMADEEATFRLGLTPPVAILRTIQLSVARIQGRLVAFEFLLSLAGPHWQLRYNLPTPSLRDSENLTEHGCRDTEIRATKPMIGQTAGDRR